MERTDGATELLLSSNTSGLKLQVLIYKGFNTFYKVRTLSKRCKSEERKTISPH